LLAFLRIIPPINFIAYPEMKARRYSVEINDPADVVSVADSADKAEAGSWAANVDLFEAHNIYANIAEVLDLKPGDIHSDLGSGYGYLLGYAKRLFPQARLVGVDTNRHHMDIAALNLRDNFHQRVQALLTQTAALDEKRSCLTRAYDPSNVHPWMLASRENPTLLIQDDMTRLRVLYTLLEGRKLDSASYTFPASYNTKPWEIPGALNNFTTNSNDPSALKLIEQEVDRLHKKASLSMSKIVFTLMSRLVKPGGGFVVAREAAVNRDVHADDEILNDYGSCCGDSQFDHFPHLAEYWDYTEFRASAALDRPEGACGLFSTDEFGKENTPADTSNYVDQAIIMRYVRNNVPCRV